MKFIFVFYIDIFSFNLIYIFIISLNILTKISSTFVLKKPLYIFFLKKTLDLIVVKLLWRAES